MKKITLLLGMLSITFMAFSQDFRCPLFVKRNNGNAGGCDARISFYYATCPPVDYQVTGILDNGTLITGLSFTAQPCLNGRIDVCIIGSNIPPVGGLTLQFFDPATGQFFICPVEEGGPQPVKLNAFYAKRNTNAVAITWKSDAELFAKEYVVERKSGNTWITVGTVQASNRATGGSYSVADKNAYSGVSQYRLKMVDIDGSISYSEIRTVKGKSTVSNFTVFPNPSTGNAKVSITDISDPTEVQLIDNSGRVLKNVSLVNSSSVDLHNLQKGLYMIRITNKTSGESLTKKLTVAN